MATTLTAFVQEYTNEADVPMFLPCDLLPVPRRLERSVRSRLRILLSRISAFRVMPSQDVSTDVCGANRWYERDVSEVIKTVLSCVTTTS